MTPQSLRVLTTIRIAVLTCAVITTAPGSALPASPPLDHDALTAVAERVREAHDQPALSVAVVHGDSVLTAACGTLALHVDMPVMPDHRFHIGSCTKALTATVIGMLVEEGMLSWETRVVDVFPDLRKTVLDDYATVTLRDLLTHRAGVRQATAGASEEAIRLRQLTGTPREQRQRAVSVILGLSPVVEPRSEARYSNAGYGIAAAMAERAADASWEDLLRTRIFEPLGMDRAGFGWPATPDQTDEPHGHWTAPGPLTPVPLTSAYILVPAIAPAGDVHCSANDLSTFVAMHMRALQGDDSGPLSPATARDLHDPDHTMGWVRRDVAGAEASWHNGSAGTFFTWMTIWPQHDLAIVVCTNAGTGQPACEALTTAIFRACVPSPESAPSADPAD